MKKGLIWLLLTALLLPTLAACGAGGTTTSTDTPTATPTDEPTEKETSKPKETKPADFDDEGNIALDGWSDYVIVIGADCTQSEKTAARELALYIKKMSGATLRINTDDKPEAEKELVVGRTTREAEGDFDREELGDEGFVIKTVGKKLFIVGGEKRGTLYGVYTYLENYLGCRFYTMDFEKVPEYNALPFIEIEEDKQIPVITTRDSSWYPSRSVSFFPKAKMNSGRSGTISTLYGGCDSWAGSTCHTLYALAEMSGDSFNHEPCLSDEKVYETVLKNVLSLLRANPDAKYISVSQNDSDTRDHACKCDKCQATFEETGARSGVYLKFVNRIADAIKDEFPNVMIHTFAYKFTREAPVGIKPADNVMVQLCTIEACFRHPLDECTCDISGNETDFKRIFEEWSALCNYMSVWDYTTDFYSFNISFPNFEAIYENMHFFADNNVKFLFEQGNGEVYNGEFSALRSYLISRLLWDPYMSKEQYYAYMDEFLLDYYGAGAPKIREYIDLMQSESENSCVHIYDYPDEIYKNTIRTVREKSELPTDVTEEELRATKTLDWTPYYDWFTEIKPNHIIEKGKQLFTEAYELAATDQQRYNVSLSAVQIQSMALYYAYERKQIVEQNVYDVAYGLALKLLDADDSLASFVANAARSEVARDLKEEYVALSRAYFDAIIKYGLKEREHVARFEPDGSYDFTKLPREWIVK